MNNSYIVQRMGQGVYIREIDPESCNVHYDKREAWDFAQKLAAPANRARPKKPAADHITFIDIDGNRKIVA